jgi:uncharacterized protein YidB (DUF937 family)
MGWMDSLIGTATQAAMGSLPSNPTPAGGASGWQAPPKRMGVVVTLINNAGGLPGILAKLQAAGLGEAVQSWVGTGANQPVSADQLGGALGSDLMGMLAQQLGGNTQQAAGTLADLLPGLIDQLTPQGQMPADNGMGALGALLGGSGGGNANDLMGMLGGLLQKR